MGKKEYKRLQFDFSTAAIERLILESVAKNMQRIA